MKKLYIAFVIICIASSMIAPVEAQKFLKKCMTGLQENGTQLLHLIKQQKFTEIDSAI